MIIVSIFRCDYRVIGDLVLLPEVPNLEIEIQEGYTISFKNGEVNEEGHTINLILTIIGPGTSIETAEKELRNILAQKLDLLTFVTHSRFKIVAPIKLIEWDEGEKDRMFKAFHTVDACYPPDPELIIEYLNTIVSLEEVAPPKFTRTALKYFRYGLLDEQADDQFMRLWLSLEIIAENIKDKEKVPINCPECKTAMICNVCGTEPTRVPMAKQAIEHLIFKVFGDEGEDVAKRQFETRNGLMHGRSTESIEKKCKMPMSELVDELGTLAWNAIMSTFTIRDEVSLHFGHRGGSFTNKVITASVTGRFEHPDDSAHPEDDKIPNVKISMGTNFGKADL